MHYRNTCLLRRSADALVLAFLYARWQEERRAAAALMVRFAHFNDDKGRYFHDTRARVIASRRRFPRSGGAAGVALVMTRCNDAMPG